MGPGLAMFHPRVGVKKKRAFGRPILRTFAGIKKNGGSDHNDDCSTSKESRYVTFIRFRRVFTSMNLPFCLVGYVNIPRKLLNSWFIP